MYLCSIAATHGASRFINPKSGFLSQIRSSRLGFSRCSQPMAVTMDRNQSCWPSIEVDIQDYLKKAIPIRPPESVFEPMHYLTFAAPPSKAPALCLASCEMIGGDRSRAMAAAAALHIMHAALYTHEHLPVTDRPMTNSEAPHKYGPNIELLTVDGMIPFGFELLARSMDNGEADPDKILRVIVEISRAIGSQGMIDGLYRKLEIKESQGGTDWSVMDYVWKKNDGELHACGAACGAILGGGDEEEIEKLRHYGLCVGMIHGMLNGAGKDEEGLIEEKVEGLRTLGLRELEIFEPKKVERISSFSSTSIRDLIPMV